VIIFQSGEVKAPGYDGTMIPCRLSRRSKMRVARQMLTESLLLSLMGGAGGLLLGYLGRDILPRLFSSSWGPVALQTRFDWRVLELCCCHLFARNGKGSRNTDRMRSFIVASSQLRQIGAHLEGACSMHENHR